MENENIEVLETEETVEPVEEVIGEEGIYDEGIGTLTEDVEQDVVDTEDDFYKESLEDENIEILEVIEEDNEEAE